jgi:TRAP-type mannitol/chloroaromatic compound transport system permease large subunit
VSQFLIAYLPAIMFASLILLLLIGYPVTFSLAANGLFYGVVAIRLGLLTPALLQALPERIFGIMRNDTYLAVPFFTFMGLILERSGMAEDLLDTIGQLFGRLRGGLAYAVVFVGALLAATTGVVAASVISMGLISLPIMLRYGYDRRVAAGVIAASGTLAQIIPPSLVLIVMADQLGRSVGDMYEGAFIPGIGLACFYAAYIFLVTTIRPRAAPALPPEAITIGEASGKPGYTSLVVVVALAFIGGYLLSYALVWIWAAALAGLATYLLAVADRYLNLRLLSRLTQRVCFVMMPPLALIFLVLGTIFIGVATPTEGGAMGASGSLILALANRRLDLKLLRQAMDTTAKLSCFVIFILIGSTVFTLTFRGVNGDLWVESLLTSLPGGQVGFLIVTNLMTFVLAFFLDYFELAFIIVPLLGPVAEKLGIDLIWFGVLLGVNMQTSFMHPPFGFALFYLRSVAPAKDYLDRVTRKLIPPVTTGQIYWGAIPFVLIQLIMVGLIIAFPRLVLASLDTGPKVNPNDIHYEVPQEDQSDQPPDFK